MLFYTKSREGQNHGRKAGVTRRNQAAAASLFEGMFAQHSGVVVSGLSGSGALDPG